MNSAWISSVRQSGKLTGQTVRASAATASVAGNNSWWIQPAARERWLAPSISWYTPQMVEVTIRDAMMGDLTRQWEMFDLMERTWPRLLGNLGKLKEKATSIEWHVQPWALRGEKPSPKAILRAKYFDAGIFGMKPDVFEDECDWEGTIKNVLDAWGKCISAQETSWQVRNYSGGRFVMPRATRWVHPRFYGYPTSGQVDRLMLNASALAGQTTAGKDNWIDFDPNKFIVGVAKMKSGHPTGAALLQALGFFWAAMNFSWEWFLNYGQIFGLPIRWANYAESADAGTISRIEAMLQDMGSAGWAAFPEGTDLKLLEAVKGAGENPQTNLIDRADKICDILVLGQTLTSDVGASGSRALGNVHADVLSDREKAVCRFAASTINSTLAPAFCRLNWGDDDECPYVVPDIQDDEDLNKVATGIAAAQKTGMRVSVAWAHERTGIPLPAPDEPVLVPVAPSPFGQPGTATDSPVDPEEDPEADPATDNEDPNHPENMGDRRKKEAARAKKAEQDAQQQLADAVAQSITGVSAKWLGGARPWFLRLIQTANDPAVSDEEFYSLIERTVKNLPDELAPMLDIDSLQTAMEKNMGASAVNGAVGGYLKRRKRKGGA